MMPGLDGPELCRRVREELSDRYTYIVLVTGMGRRQQVLEGMGAGADDYLIKPVDPFDVETRLVAAERVTALHRQVVDYRAQLEQANTKLLDLSLTDALTGLGNRRRMEQDLVRTYARARRLNRPFSVALFDIDHFKLYNDHYGHLGGDEVLRQVASIMGQVLRQDESLYRYGGEEFLLLVPDGAGRDAVVAAERCRVAVEQAALPHEARPSTPPVVTLSGAAWSWAPSVPLSIHELLARADEGLYQAKSAGRNRIHGTVTAQRAPMLDSVTHQA
jgi:diguanylate cyclase (GGDEF)-like protein